MQKIVKIEIFPKRFTVKLPFFMRDLLECFRSVDKRFWNASEKIWTFPIESYDKISNAILSSPSCSDFKIKVKDKVKEMNPKAVIIKNGSCYDLKFSKYIENFSDFRNINGVEYQPNFRKFILPSESLQPVINAINSNKMQYEIIEEINCFESEGEMKIDSSEENSTTTTTTISPLTTKCKKDENGKKKIKRKLNFSLF